MDMHIALNSLILLIMLWRTSSYIFLTGENLSAFLQNSNTWWQKCSGVGNICISLGPDQENRSYSKHVIPRDFNAKNMSQRQWGNWDISKSRNAPATSKLQELACMGAWVWKKLESYQGWPVQAEKRRKNIYRYCTLETEERRNSWTFPFPIPIRLSATFPNASQLSTQSRDRWGTNRAEGCKHTTHLIWLLC